jgi:hypothetical protein
MTQAEDQENRAVSQLPQTLGGVFDEAFDLYKRHFSTLAMIVAIALIPTQILLHTIVAIWLRPLAHSLSGPNPDVDLLLLMRFGYFLTGDPREGYPGLISLVLPILISGPMSVAVSDIYLRKTPSAWDAYRRARPFLPRLLGGYILIGLAFIAVTAVSFLVLSMVMGVLATVVSWLGAEEIGIVFVILMILGPYLLGCALVARDFAFTTPILVLEGAPLSFLSSRNKQLVGPTRFRRTWGALVFLPIVTFGLQFLILQAIVMTLHSFAVPALLQFIVETALGTATAFFFQPFWMIFITLLYYDYRVRREGFDLRVLSLGMPILEPIDEPPPSSTQEAL